MARTFIVKDQGPIIATNFGEATGYDINASEATSSLDIAVFTNTTFDPARNKLFASLNEGNIGGSPQKLEIPLDTVLAKTDGTFIIQGSIPLNQLQLKDNIIQLKIQKDISNTTPPAPLEFAFVRGFVEDATLEIRIQNTPVVRTPDVDFWEAILGNSLNFADYKGYIDDILCDPNGSVPGNANIPPFNRGYAKVRSPFIQSEEYNIIKYATEYFMAKKLGISGMNLSNYFTPKGNLPYFESVGGFELISRTYENRVARLSNKTLDECDIREADRLQNPILIELIWNYWMEQSMLVQTMNAISLRFQNLYNLPYIKPLERFDTSPLKPLSYILWGYIQDEQHRLSLKRRAYEYEHEYGLSLLGKAVPQFNPADRRAKFLEVFHDLLTSCILFFRETDDTTRRPDAFPVLNNLREVHLLLAAGNNNAYGNLTWTARHEMLVQQYILATDEMKDFLGGKPMIPYNEDWMDRVETMRSIQGWGNTSINNFYDLAVCGEQILISIRLGNWNNLNTGSDNADNWARKFRDRIQRYVHAYRVVTGVDLSEEVVDSKTKELRYVEPSVLIQQRVFNNGNVSKSMVPAKSYYQ